MFGSTKAKCSKCKREIRNNEPILVKLRYPEKRGMAEIRAFLKQEGTIICEECTMKFLQTK
jgi:hypothetical protein